MLASTQNTTSHKVSFYFIFKELISQTWTHRFLISQLLKRDFISANKRGLFKYFWIFIAPIMSSVSWIFLNRAGVLNPGNTSNVPYPLYILLGTSIWSLHLGLITMIGTTLTGTSGFASKIKIPHEVFFVKNLIHQLILFIIGFSLNIIILAWYGVPFDTRFLLFPFLLLPLILFASGVGLIVAVLNVIISDASNIVTTIFGILIYITPVMYISVADPRIQMIIDYNPITHLIASPRDMLLFGKLYDSQAFLFSSAIACVTYGLCLMFFYKVKWRLIEKMP